MRFSAAILLLPSVAFAIPFSRPNSRFDRRTAAFDIEEDFRNPLAINRPRFRYWVPSAKVDPAVVAHDVKEIAEKGFGGAEYVHFAGYGSNDTQADPSQYNWIANQASYDAVSSFYQAGADNGVYLDWAQSPVQGASAALLSPDDRGAARELARGTIAVARGSTYNGPPPPPLVSLNITSRTLVAVVTAKLAQPLNNDSTVSQASFPTDGGGSVQLDLSSLTVLPVGNDDQSISFTASDGDYLVFSFWSQTTGFRSSVGGYNGYDPSNPASWANWQADHFSEEGADAIIAINTQYFKTVLGDAWASPTGKYLWEDSLELNTQNIFFPRNMLDTFAQGRGYDLARYLPLLYVNASTDITGGHYGASLPPLFTGSDTRSQQDAIQIRNDFYAQLTAGYKSYVKKLSDFAHSVGLEYSSQPGYGQSVDIQAVLPYLDTPEIETLAFNNNVTGYRLVSGGAHLAKAKYLSSEAGAAIFAAYQYTIPSLLKDLYTSFAGGVNTFVLHGYPYSGSYGIWPKTPGWEAWFYLFAEAYGPRQPSWEYIKPVADALGRAQTVLSAGQPCVDLALYRLSYTDDNFSPDWEARAFIPVKEFQTIGFTYEFVSPALLALPSSVVTDKRLSAEGGPGYKALILDNTTVADLNGLKNVLSLAQAGLPVVFIGSTPSSSPYFSESSDGIQQLVQQILSVSTTKEVGTHAEAVEVLAGLSVEPSASYQSPVDDVFTVKRFDPFAGADYYYVYNLGDSPVTLDIAYENPRQQTPYRMNVHTGDIVPLGLYSLGNESTTVTSMLGPNTFEIIAFTDSLSQKGPAVWASDVTYATVRYTDGKGLEARATKSGSVSITLSDGTIKTANVVVPPSTNLTNWNLTVTAWQPLPDNAISTGHTTRTLQFDNVNSTLWGDIPAIANSSGTGVYTSSFDWSLDYGAVLDLVSCYQTCNVSVNGQPTPAFDPVNPVIDISDLLHSGENEIQIEVSTPLGNLVRLLSATPGSNPVLNGGMATVYSKEGTLPFNSLPPYVALYPWNPAYGLQDTPRILPYVSIPLA